MEQRRPKKIAICPYPVPNASSQRISVFLKSNLIFFFLQFLGLSNCF